MADEAEKALDPVAVFIVDYLNAAPAGELVDPVHIAKALADTKRKQNDPADLWRRYKMAVNQQAKFLARSGVIEITRKGEAVDPTEPIKGLIKLRLV